MLLKFLENCQYFWINFQLEKKILRIHFPGMHGKSNFCLYYIIQSKEYQIRIMGL